MACIGRDLYNADLLFDLLDEAPIEVYINDGGRLQEDMDQVSKKIKDIELHIGYDIDQSKIVLD